MSYFHILSFTLQNIQVNLTLINYNKEYIDHILCLIPIQMLCFCIDEICFDPLLVISEFKVVVFTMLCFLGPLACLLLDCVINNV